MKGSAAGTDLGEDEKRRIRSRIGRDIDPGKGLSHRKGQPKAAPHATKPSTTARFLTNCAQEHAASLTCIEQNYQNRAVCQPFFDNYRQCRKEEEDRRKDANAKASGATGGGWFW